MENTKKELLLILAVIFIHCVPAGTNESSKTEQEESPCAASPGFRSETVKAVVGKKATLPCRTNLNFNKNDVIMSWEKDGTDIYNFKEGKAYNYNDKVIPPSEKQLEEGNGTISLCEVEKSDAGKYCCCFHKTENTEAECVSVTLVVEENTQTSSDDNNCITAGVIGGVIGGVVGGVVGGVLVYKCRK